MSFSYGLDMQLLDAVRSSNASEVARLIARGADENAAEEWRGWPLICSASMLAIYNEDADCLEVLLKAGVNSNKILDDLVPLIVWTAGIGGSECLELLLGYGGDVDAFTIGYSGYGPKKTTALMAAIKGVNDHDSRYDTVEVLMDLGADVHVKDADGFTALMWASAKCRLNCLELLLRYDADWDIQELEKALDVAVGKKQINFLEGRISLLRSRRAAAPPSPPSSQGIGELLCKAIDAYQLDEIVRLLNNDADLVNSEEGLKATGYAILCDCPDCLQLFLNCGADVNRIFPPELVVGEQGITPLMLAASLGSFKCAELLLKHGAHPNTRTNRGETALTVAARRGSIECVQLLFDHGADLNIIVDDQLTALIIAAKNGRISCLELLLERGANSDIGKMKEALEMAISKGHSDCVKVLIRHIETQEIVAQNLQQMERLALNSSGSTPSAPPTPTVPTTTAPSPIQSHRIEFSQQNWFIAFDQLELANEPMGAGSYGKVYRATWHGTDVAAKLFQVPNGNTSSQAQFSASLMSKIKEEVELLASIRHPHVVAYLGMCSNPPCMVTELCDQGSLFDVMERCKSDPAVAAKLTWKRRLNMLADAAAGMAHLHGREKPIIHRDLKSLNLLVDSAWRVKIADFGLSKIVKEATTESRAGDTMRNMNFRWLSPEVLQTGKWIQASDVYAFGVVMWEILTWELPWNHIENEIMIPMAIVQGDQLPIPELSTLPGPRPLSNATYDRYRQLTKACMDKYHSQRPNFTDIAKILREIAVDEGNNSPADSPVRNTTAATAVTSSRNPTSGLMECGICLEPMGNDQEKSVAMPPCGHVYCYDCLVRIDRDAQEMYESASCPACRQSYTESDVKRVFFP